MFLTSNTIQCRASSQVSLSIENNTFAISVIQCSPVFLIKMTKTCSVKGCTTNHRKLVNSKSMVSNPGDTMTKFPHGEKQQHLLPAWERFCNRKHELPITNNSGICVKHFDDKFITCGTRKTLKWDMNPVPTKYSSHTPVPLSVLPPNPPYRKPHADRASPDEINGFRQANEIKSKESSRYLVTFVLPASWRYTKITRRPYSIKWKRIR